MKEEENLNRCLLYIKDTIYCCIHYFVNYIVVRINKKLFHGNNHKIKSRIPIIFCGGGGSAVRMV